MQIAISEACEEDCARFQDKLAACFCSARSSRSLPHQTVRGNISMRDPCEARGDREMTSNSLTDNMLFIHEFT